MEENRKLCPYGSDEYASYLASQHWQFTKEKRIRIDGGKCYFCGTQEALAVHHLHYDNIGREDVENDLVTVCRSCHRKLHSLVSKMPSVNIANKLEPCSEAVGVVWRTKNYSAFRYLENNRTVDNAHVKRLMKSFAENGYIPAPILVNERMEELDGQHRAKAAERSELPIYYVVIDGAGETECRVLNKDQKKWSLMDHIEAAAKSGDETALIISRIVHENGDMQKNVVLCSVLNYLHPKMLSKTISRRMDYGTLDIGTYMEANERVQTMRQITDLVKDSFEGDYRLFAIVACRSIRDGIAERGKVIERLEKRPFGTMTAPTVDSAIQMFAHIYCGKNASKAKKLEYLRLCRETMGVL